MYVSIDPEPGISSEYLNRQQTLAQRWTNVNDVVAKMSQSDLLRYQVTVWDSKILFLMQCNAILIYRPLTPDDNVKSK